MIRRRPLLLLPLLLAAPPVSAQAEAFDLAQLTSGGPWILMMRHALAPGTGDPDNFALRDCATQRNLNDAGRAQARAIGEAIRAAGITVAAVGSSQWCRCLETARLAFPEAPPVEEWPELNSFFEDRSQSGPQTRALLARLRAWRAAASPPQVLVLVTHQVNITALTGVVPSSGEALALALDAGAGAEPRILGRWLIPA